MSNYGFYTKATANTPQTEPIPLREAEMVKGASGAVAFKADVWAVLRRCLIMGTADGSFYAGKQELTKDFAVILNEAIALDVQRVADEIVYASNGKAINNSSSLFALALFSTAESYLANKLFKEIFPKVVRTGSHFHEWLSYTKGIRGLGRSIRTVAKDWIQKGDTDLEAYQMLKYGQRHGFSFRDALRLFKPIPQTDCQKNLYAWVVGKPYDLEQVPKIIKGYEWLKANPDRGVEAVKTYGLTHEMVAPVAKMNQDVWQALFETMPVTALLRNLASLTEIGVINVKAIANLNRVESIFTNQETLRKARVHPMDILKALKIYQSGGRLGLSQKTWIPVARIVDILKKALELSFYTQERTNKVFFHAIDVSGSMGWTNATFNLKKENDPNNKILTCCEIATVMALVSIKSEPNYFIGGFSTKFKQLGLTASDSFSSATKKIPEMNYGGTDAASAYDYAIKNKIYFDVICFWTDFESWAGKRHPSQALADYRKKVNPKAKAIYTTLAPNELDLADPKDRNSWSFNGFDPTIPSLIQSIAGDEV